ncbi:MAG: hypothetical protein EXS49_02335 [Candidatus Pacebacteria bacterium]|nr:hypothetical protein [Candidatus Paceibacterota bacterium]
MNKEKIILISVIVVIILTIGAVVFQRTAPGKYDGFAACLKEKNVTFFGAFWCSHCQSQKKLFGNSAKRLPYVECSTPDRKNQTQICKDENIKSYPTWRFADGSEQTGEVFLENLAEKSGCELPASK